MARITAGSRRFRAWSFFRFPSAAVVARHIRFRELP